MTFLKVYNRNGHCGNNDVARYGYTHLNTAFPWHSFRQWDAMHGSPRVNITEDKGSFKLILEVPGMEKERITMDISKDILTVRGAERENAPEEKYSYREFNYGGFERAFRVPDSVDTGAITAGYSNGILTVVLPKKEEAVDKGPRNIEVS